MGLSPRIHKLGITLEETPEGFRLSDREKGLLFAKLSLNTPLISMETEAKLYLIEQGRLPWAEW